MILDMHETIGLALVVWGLVQMHSGKAWYGSRYGVARFTADDDGWVFWLVCGLVVVAGLVCIMHE